MGVPSDNETWVVDAGGDVVEKMVANGYSQLTPLEKLMYCLWVADYGMRNAGDLETAKDVYPLFQEEAARMAKSLSLKFTYESFALKGEVLEQQYFDRFERICDEIKS